MFKLKKTIPQMVPQFGAPPAPMTPLNPLQPAAPHMGPPPSGPPPTQPVMMGGTDKEKVESYCLSHDVCAIKLHSSLFEVFLCYVFFFLHFLLIYEFLLLDGPLEFGMIFS